MFEQLGRLTMAVVTHLESVPVWFLATGEASLVTGIDGSRTAH